MQISSTNTTKEECPLNKRYENVKICGNGTFGIVYLAHDTMGVSNQKVAIKNVHQNTKYKNRELEILKEVNHKNIIKLINYFYEEKKEHGTYLNLIMQYVPHTLSSTIKDHIYSKSFIEQKLVIKYAYGLLSALAYLEEKGIAHRDIKPSNILLSDDNQAKLCDFGSAKRLVQGQKNIAYICSRYYRSPQLILGATNYTIKTDIWSVGCCICQMLINTAMFDGGNNTSLLIKIIKYLGSPSDLQLKAMKVDKDHINKVQGSGIRQRITKINPSVSVELLELIEKILVYDPSKRISPKQAMKLPLFKQLYSDDNAMGEQGQPLSG